MSKKKEQELPEQEIVEEKVEEPKVAPVQQKDKAENLTYVGPTIRNVIKRFTTFEKGILPESVEQKINEFPAMKILFVKAEDLPKAAADMVKQSALCSVYEQVKNKFI